MTVGGPNKPSGLGRQVVEWVDLSSVNPKSSAPRRATGEPVGPKSEALLGANAAGVRLSLVRGADVTAPHFVVGVPPSHIYIQWVCLENLNEAERRWKSESYLTG